MDDGKFTIVASGNDEYAFVENVVPGSDDASAMEITLEDPGALKGEIVNSLELRGTGSVVTHLIGTDIYQNVDNNGRFIIENVPAGTYTMVSYSTYQPEFSPYYRKVSIYPDSVTDLNTFELKYNGIPIPKGIEVSYDTAHQVVMVRWNAIGEYNDFQEYAILRGVAGMEKHQLQQIGYTKDTVWYDTMSFSGSNPDNPGVACEYAVLVTNKLGEFGQYFGNYEIQVVPYDVAWPKITVEDEVFAEINSEVQLKGSVVRSVYPIVKQEWKIGDGDWTECEDGEVVFTADSMWGPETTLCYYRVEDSIGKSVSDSMRVISGMFVTTYGKLPGEKQATSCVFFKDKFWSVTNGSDENKVWSSNDLSSWSVESSAPQMEELDQWVVFKGSLYGWCLNYNRKVYKTADGIEWCSYEPELDVSAVSDETSFVRVSL